MSGRTRIAIPNKGRLAAPTLDLLDEAGFVFEATARTLSVPVRNMPVEILFVRAADIPELVSDGVADFGVTGLDLVAEAPLETTVHVELGFGRCRLAVAVEERSPIASIDEFAGLRVATSHPRTVSAFFADKGIDVTMVPLSGSVEVAPKLGIADAIVDLVSSGSTLMTNGLRPIATILESQAALIAATADARPQIPTLVRSVVAARRKRYVLMNAPVEAVPTISDIIPGADAPTVVPLATEGMVAIHSVVDSEDTWRVIPELEEAGASAILVLPITQMIP